MRVLITGEVEVSGRAKSKWPRPEQPLMDQDQTIDETLDDSLLGDFEDQVESPASTSPSSRRDYTFIESIDEQVDHNGSRSMSVSPSRQVTLPHGGVFKHISSVVKKRLLLVGRRIHFSAGVQLNSVGDPCQGLSFILSGQIKVEWMDALSWVPIAKLTPGDVIGAMEWYSSKIWEERIIAESDTLILFLPTPILTPLSATYPDLQRQVERYTERHNLHALLGANPLFQGLPDESLMKLIDIANMRYVDQGAVIFSPRMLISLIFVVGRGELELLYGERVVQVLGRGEVANLELARGDGVNVITARTLRASTLYVLPFEQIEFLLAQHNRLQDLQTEASLLRARALNQ